MKLTSSMKISGNSFFASVSCFPFLILNFKKMQAYACIQKIIKPPLPCIVQHILYMPLNTPYNVLYGVGHIRLHIVRKVLHRACKYRLPVHFLSSLIVLQHSKVLHIPCLTEYTLPSSSHLLPACRRKHNDYR